jgi:hypothetical protein
LRAIFFFFGFGSKKLAKLFGSKKLAKLFGVLCVSFGQEFLAEKSGRLRRFLGSKSLDLPYVYLVNTLEMPLFYLIFGKKEAFCKKR